MSLSLQRVWRLVVQPRGGGDLGRGVWAERHLESNTGQDVEAGLGLNEVLPRLTLPFVTPAVGWTGWLFRCWRSGEAGSGRKMPRSAHSEPLVPLRCPRGGVK